MNEVLFVGLNSLGDASTNLFNNVVCPPLRTGDDLGFGLLIGSALCDRGEKNCVFILLGVTSLKVTDFAGVFGTSRRTIFGFSLPDSDDDLFKGTAVVVCPYGLKKSARSRRFCGGGIGDEVHAGYCRSYWLLGHGGS